MGKLTADEVITQQHKRAFVQFGGALPLNLVKYAGQDAQYIRIDGVTIPQKGETESLYMPDPRKRGDYKMVGRKRTPPDTPSANIIMAESHGAIPMALRKQGCAANFYEMTGQCEDPSDFTNGWSDYVLIYSQGEAKSTDGGSRSAWDGDDLVEDTIAFNFEAIYPIGKISFGDSAPSLITLEVIDVAFGSVEQCAECGVADDGTKRIYAVTKSSGSTPGTSPKVIYSTDGGLTWTSVSVDGLGDTEDPQGIDVAGKYVFVYTRTAGGATTSGYYYAEINALTGVPSAWTKVTSGFVASFQIYDAFVLSPREVFFVADGGYIYKASDLTAGVSVINNGNTTTTALRRIHGTDECLIAVGGSGLVIKSLNRGITWATTTTSPITATLQAVFVLSEFNYWVGSANGTLHYTLNGGETWTSFTFSGSGAGQVRDIVFASAEVGYFSHDTATPSGRIFATYNGGASWGSGKSRIQNTPTANRYNRIAVPTAHPSIAANKLAVSGLAGNGSDGILLVGDANTL